MSFPETLAAIREQNGLVYLPHPFDRMHTIPDPATLHLSRRRHVYSAALFEAMTGLPLRAQVRPDDGGGSDAHVQRAFLAHRISLRETPRSCAARHLQTPEWMANQGKGQLGEIQGLSTYETGWIPKAVP